MKDFGDFIEDSVYDGAYDREIVEQVCFYYAKYNDWDTLEKETKSKIDETRTWTSSAIHEMLMHIKKTMEKLQSETQGIYIKKDGWFHPEGMQLKHWEFYHRMMQKEHFSPERIARIHKESTDIVNFLPNPNKKPVDDNFKDFVVKGLVYGNVQSGKTASIAGLIAMYASVGCKLVIVLSGVTNNLRLQTQERLIHDLNIGENGNSGYIKLTREVDKIVAGTEDIDTLLGGKATLIGIFKKLPFALKSLIKYCKRVNDLSIYEHYSVLIIDDECDQYSPNVKLHDTDSGEEYEHSAVNKLIVELIKCFKRVCYVGYTATPFATVLNETPGSETLYPRDFIYSIKKDENYYGSEKVFGENEEDDKVLNAINYVNSDEVKLLRKNAFSLIPKGLKDAIDYFIVATACKYCRGLTSHSSMLVHIDLKTKVHETLESIINNYIKTLKGDYSPTSEVGLDLKRIWEKEKGKNPASLISELFLWAKTEDYRLPEFSEMESEIALTLEKLEVIVDNSTRPIEERLSYEDENPRVCIVIGGNTLSRGLTLEGLTVSYFGRGSRTYDTLLQMGRWFGYRKGYEDLSRLWMSGDLVERFMFLIQVENEIREEIEDHAFNMSPEEYSLRIRLNPKMQITRRRAMQCATISSISFNGDYTETSFLNRKDKTVIERNFLATKKFLSSLDFQNERKNGAALFRDCNTENIVSFIRDYQFSEREKTSRRTALLEYIDKANKKGLLSKWVVAVKTNESEKGTRVIEFTEKLKCNCIGRARINENVDKAECYIKMHAPKDFMLDIDEESYKSISKKGVSLNNQFRAREDYYRKLGKRVPGLLVIYPINKDSIPKHPENKTFIPLNAVDDLIGLLFIFPLEKDRDLYQYMQIDLPQNIESEVYDEEE